jgi:hypothetical protein
MVEEKEEGDMSAPTQWTLLRSSLTSKTCVQSMLQYQPRFPTAVDDGGKNKDNNRPCITSTPIQQQSSMVAMTRTTTKKRGHAGLVGCELPIS